MRVLPRSRSIHFFWEELTYLEAALKADEETEALAEPVTVTLDDFASISQSDLDTRRALIQAHARAGVADINLDDALRDVHGNTLHLVKQDRSSKEYQALFAGTLSELIRHALAKQVVLARELINKLKLSLFTPEFRNTQETVLQAPISKGEAVLEQRKQAELDRAEGRLTIEAWKDEVNAVRTSVYAELLKLASKTKRKRSWAEAFFPKTSSRSAREDEVEVVVELEPAGQSE